MSLNQTPSADRLHIGIFGRTNSGKSSFVNALTGQQVSIVSEVPGTTTDVVYKAMEIHPLGACVLMDTAGFMDDSTLGDARLEKTKEAAEKADIAVLIFSEGEIKAELEWYQRLKQDNTPTLCVINKSDIKKDLQGIIENIEENTRRHPLVISALTGEGMDKVTDELVRLLPESYGADFITAGLVKEDDVVLLVMPQDMQAPKGRLILPQVQTIRELLDRKCTVIATTTDKLKNAVAALKNPPKLIITDSQVFSYVYENKPAESMLTSFSVLFAAYKGDLPYYMEGAAIIDRLNENSRVLIAECCTHAPLEEDIGRVKIPNMLRKRFGEGLQVDIKAGVDFPQDLSGYDLIIQCGACMFNRKYVLSRIERAKQQQVPMTNYGVVIAHLTGILDKISLP